MGKNQREPTAELHSQFSSEGAAPTAWGRARELLEEAKIYWVTTVRPDGRPHVTPLLCVWLDSALYFTTGPGERKAKNLTQNRHCIITTGCNVLEGFDVVVEGEAVEVSDEGRLRQLAGMYASKYGWHYTVREGAFHGEGGRALVYELAPKMAFAFGKGESFSQTRYRF
ncbi:MAG: pyridoxamine 5'-phosphate oxidase family protein [Chloroflexia bacterium]